MPMYIYRYNLWACKTHKMREVGYGILSILESYDSRMDILALSLKDAISNDKSNVTPCMLQLVEKWFVHEDGTGDLPRTWQTVVQVVKHTGKGRLAEQLAEQYRVQLPVQ